MKRFGFYISSYALKAFSPFSKARIQVHGDQNIPSEGSVVFNPNHFTRIETVFLPHHIHALTKKPVWSLASGELFQNEFLRQLLQSLGAVSTKDPDRYYLITKSMITGEASWVIFPEGMMVKNKKLINHDHFEISKDNEIIKPHTGAATIALRCEFYRERLRRMKEKNRTEFDRLLTHFEIRDWEKILQIETYIVPVNITYYPISAKENFLSKVALKIVENPSQRALEELMTEGTMVLSGVDVDIRFGAPIRVKEYLFNSFVESDLSSRRKIHFDRHICSRPVMKESSARIMKKFLSATYAMTTVNHDHILAGILKHLPPALQGEEIYFLKCRLYLAVNHIVTLNGVCVHDSFQGNQIHLLTDDRFKKTETFIKTAVDTGVIRVEENRIYKNREKLSASSAFHTIRIENPVAVIANEIEPLKGVENYLKKIAARPDSEIKEAVKDTIHSKVLKEYRTDLNNFGSQAPAEEKKSGQPIYLQGKNRNAGILLVHGYMATPAEMEVFARYLNKNSYSVFVPRLKGHGTSPDDLMEREYGEWIENVEEGYVFLRVTHKKIFVGGFSTGAALALELCSRIKDIEAVFAVAPPMRLSDLGAHFVPAVDMFNRIMTKAGLKGLAKEFVNNEPENPDINYTKNPVAGIHQLEKLMKNLEQRLDRITLPVLVVQARNDPVVSSNGTYKLFKKLGSSQKEYFLFDFHRHGILLGKEAKRVYNSIEGFIRQWLTP